MTPEQHPHYGDYAMHSRYGVQWVSPTDVADTVDVDDTDVRCAIEVDGWAGCYCDVEPVVLVECDGTDTCLTLDDPEALAYLHQPREITVV